MKKSKTELKKALQDFISKMTKEEFAASLAKAGLDFYKNITTPVFSSPEDSASKRSRKVDNYSDKANKERTIGSLPIPEFDYYKNVQVPFFKIPQNVNVDWAITHINSVTEFPCLLSPRETISAWTLSLGKWYVLPSDTKFGTDEICEIEYDMAA